MKIKYKLSPQMEMAARFLMHRIRRRITIKDPPPFIRVKEIATRALITESTGGYTWHDDDGSVVVTIYSKLPLAKKIIIMAHEFWHIRQRLCGDYTPLGSGRGKWKGRTHILSNDAPWEVEARRMEKPLAKMCFKFMDLDNFKEIYSSMRDDYYEIAEDI